MAPLVVDYSAHNSWETCPALWYSKYIQRLRRKWPKAQRDDALALGSLVHEGLRVWQLTHTVEIPLAIQEEMTPTRECLSLAEELVYGYAQRYPEEYWPLIHCEEPLVFPLISPEKYWCRADNRPVSQCGHSYEPEHYSFPGLEGLAKIDSYFYVPEPTYIESGLPGTGYTLNPGWWIHEYKTKSPFIPMGMYMQGWEMNMQASYQMLALTHTLSAEESFRKSVGYPASEGEAPWGTVQGVLVNILEKPRRTVPKRKCSGVSGCGALSEFATWIPSGDGLYHCPSCGTKQKLMALKEATPVTPPAYYRLIVTRTPEELIRARTQIIQVGQRMIAMEAGGLHSEPWRTSACVDTKWNRACEYLPSHKQGRPVESDDPQFEFIPDYRGLVSIEGVETPQ